MIGYHSYSDDPGPKYPRMESDHVQEKDRFVREAIFTTKAHVFHIDPQTKRSWIPASSQAVNVSFFYDTARNLYRIISVEGTKAVINSTVTPNMTFTKTSQKFGQWSDIRANTVYGLGFESEPELNKFIEKFQEVKEATRNAAHQKVQQHPNGSIGTPVTSSSGSPCPSNRSILSHRIEAPDGEDLINTHMVLEPATISASSLPHQNDINCLKSPLVAHQRSQSLSGLQASKALLDSRKRNDKDKHGSTLLLPQSTTEAQLRYENDRLKLALAQSSANAKKWEIELQTLKNNNASLTNALQESTANVEEWKRQLQALKDENGKMRLKMIELEASHGNPEAIAELRKEINNLKSRADSLDIDVKEKDKEIEQLKQRLEEQVHIYSTGQKMLLTENESLRSQLSRLQDHSDNSKLSDKARKGMLDQLNLRLAQNIQELRNIQQELTALLNTS